jgi:hemoglobin
MDRVKYSILVGLLAVAVAAGCARHTAKPEASLYDRLGGKPAIAAVVGDFLEKVGADPRVRHQPPADRVAVLSVYLTDLVCQATGGPCEYRGQPMKAAHAGMGITDAEFNAVVDDLVHTLEQYRVPEREKQDLLALLAPMRQDIVEVQ